MKSRIPWFLFLLLLSAPAANAQLTRFSLTRYNTENGLRSNAINGMVQDSLGLVWIATEAGLVRFDGQQFTHFDQSNIPELESSRINELGIGRDQCLFFSNGEGALWRKTAEGFRKLASPEGDYMRFVGKKFALYGSRDLFHSVQAYDIPEGRWLDTGITPVAAERDSVLIWDARFPYFMAFTSDSIYQKPGPSFPAGISPCVLNDQLLLFNPPLGFRPLDGKDQLGTPYPLVLQSAGDEPVRLSSNQTQLFGHVNMSAPVLLSGSRAWVLRLQQDTVRGSLIAEGLPVEDQINVALYLPAYRTLLLGTRSRGLMRVESQPLKHLVVDAAGKTDAVESAYGQILLPNGNILTDQGVEFGEAPTGTHEKISALAPLGRFFFQKDQYLWVSKRHFVYRYHFPSRELLSFEANKQHSFHLFLPQQQGMVVADATGLGLIRENRYAKWFDFPPLREGDPGNESLNALVEWPGGKLALASCEGFYLLDTAARQIDTVPYFQNACVRTIWKKDGFYFFGTYGQGIHAWKDGEFRSLPLDPSGYLRYAHCFAEDPYGNIWISTNRGLFRVALQDLKDAFTEQLPMIFYQYFGKQHGMVTTEMNGRCIPCFQRLPDGTFSFPTMDGLLWAPPPLQAQHVSQPASFQIDQVLARNQELCISDSAAVFRLPENSSSAQVRLVSSRFDGSENAQIYYRLDGESDWRTLHPDDEMKIELSDLSPGSHTLRIRKMLGFGAGNHQEEQLALYVPYPWYFKWYAMPGWLALLGLIVWGISYWRTIQLRLQRSRLQAEVALKTGEIEDKRSLLEAQVRTLNQQKQQLEQSNQLRLKLLSIINHDLLAPLRFLQHTGNNLTQYQDRLPPERQQEIIREMTQTSGELFYLSRNLLNWINYQRDGIQLEYERFDLRESVDRIFKIMEGAAGNKQLTLINDLPQPFEVYHSREPVQIILYNLLINSLKCTESGHIRVTAAQNEEFLRFTVSDTGPGLSAKKITELQDLDHDHTPTTSDSTDSGLGYLIIKDLLRLLRGKICLENKAEGGLRATVSLPAANGQ